MKLKKGFFLFLLFIPKLILGQGVSVLPSYLPEYVFGTWVNDKNEIVLIISEDYIVIQNELYGYNNIVKEKEKINFTCVHNDNVQYINVTKINASNILLDEGFKITQLNKIAVNKTNKLPKSIIDNWYSLKNKIELKENEVLFSDNSYKIDYVTSSNGVNYHIIVYNSGEYSLLYNYINDNGHYLNANFLKTIVFEKASFFRKYKSILITLFIALVLLISYCLIKWKITIAKNKEVTKRLLVEMQLKSIRSQMNPHFLFNALSAIQNLINKGDNDKANHYLTEFSQLMRLTLDKSEKGLVPLYDEIESIKKYLELECLRFPFEYRIYVDSKINKHNIEIPAMLIQPFVENAIIHGLNEKKGEKHVSIDFKIDEKNLICYIIDNGIGINKVQAKKTSNLKREKYGLKLAKDRINLINENYKTNAIIKITDISDSENEKTGTKVEISMPLKY
ncbi:histidine kinase [Flavivirga aquimarina]|uniref:Histidine kinase n=1 Tax=Flavivirga aquimarina TaxID=2027862 RepID=A0ABT8W5L5_9FLAO|nr:histidine kinase [Flavivirga aquimarina]MDO5968396.1 histidine kinase [Flavivirga aquimarina]